MNTCPICHAPPGASCRGAGELHEARVHEDLRALLERADSAIEDLIMRDENFGCRAADDTIEATRGAIRTALIGRRR